MMGGCPVGGGKGGDMNGLPPRARGGFHVWTHRCELIFNGAVFNDPMDVYIHKLGVCVQMAVRDFADCVS